VLAKGPGEAARVAEPDLVGNGRETQRRIDQPPVHERHPHRRPVIVGADAEALDEQAVQMSATDADPAGDCRDRQGLAHRITHQGHRARQMAAEVRRAAQGLEMM